MKIVRLIFLPLLCGLFVAVGFEFGSGAWHLPHLRTPDVSRGSLNGRAPLLVGDRRLQRPYGMAPEAFRAYIRACANAHVHPWRIGQTIGDHPRSVGYHHKDGVIEEDGVPYDYTAALDLGALDLSEKKRNFLLECLARQGFAAFWRSGPNWKDQEHIHAVYCLIPMKPQLRAQVLEWLQERRASDKPRLRWTRKLKRSPQFRRDLS